MARPQCSKFCCVVHQGQSRSGVKALYSVLMLKRIKLLIASWMMIRTLWKWGSGAELRQSDQRGGAVGVSVAGLLISVKRGSGGIW